jgi:predicted thioesterase
VSIEPGIERSDEFTAEDRLLTDVAGSLGVKVLSTPGMISMMERCAGVGTHERRVVDRAGFGR